jgi:Sulfotransferase domain
MYSRHYSAKEMINQPQAISYDATHGYLFYSTLLPRRILCVIPWVKLVILIRDPVDRLYEHYLSARSKGLQMALDDWIDKDMRLIEQVGLAQNWTVHALRSYTGSPAEDEAWYDYQTKTLEGALGRSIYEIQLRQWFQALRAAGRDPKHSVLVIHSEYLQTNPEAVYKRLLDFVGLPAADMRIPNTTQFIQTDTSGMSSETRERLEAFFRPYNVLLHELLQSYGIQVVGE